jgi:hypothetical protein
MMVFSSFGVLQMIDIDGLARPQERQEAGYFDEKVQTYHRLK